MSKDQNNDQLSSPKDYVLKNKFVKVTLFDGSTVKNLKDQDFDLDNESAPFTLNPNNPESEKCWVITLYNEDNISWQTIDMIQSAADQLKGPNFGGVNFKSHATDGIAEAVFDIGLKPGLEARYRLVEIPSIFIFQNRVPVGVYNGNQDLQSFITFLMSRACTSGFGNLNEEINKIGKMITGPNIVVKGGGAFFSRGDSTGEPSTVSQSQIQQQGDERT